MKKLLFPLALAIPLLLTACGAQAETEEPPVEDLRGAEEIAHDEALNACQEELDSYVVAPARAEFIEQFDPHVGNALNPSIKDGYYYDTLTFADVRFISDSGAPDTQRFGCATYHGVEGDLTEAQSAVIDKSELDTFGYDRVCRKFSYEEFDADRHADEPDECRN